MRRTTSRPRVAAETRRRGWARAAAVLAAVGIMAAVTACQQTQSGPPEPEEPASASPKPEPYAAPQPTVTTEPELPAEAEQHTAAGAIAFIEHYRQLYEYGLATDNWQPLQDVTSEGCQPCSQLWNPPGTLHTRGGQPPLITYGDEDAVDLSIQAENPFVTAWIEAPNGKWVPNNDKPRKVGYEHWGVRFYLEQTQNTWTVEDLETRELSDERELDYIW